MQISPENTKVTIKILNSVLKFVGWLHSPVPSSPWPCLNTKLILYKIPWGEEKATSSKRDASFHYFLSRFSFSALRHSPRRKPRRFHSLLSTVLIYSPTAEPLSAVHAALPCAPDSHFFWCTNLIRKRKWCLCAALPLISTVLETGSIRASMYGLKEECGEEKKIYITEKLI